MDWPLMQLTREAEDVAAGLQIFLDQIPAKATDISGCMSELFGISSALRALDYALDYSRYGRFSGRITNDADLVLPSLQYTLKDVRHMFSQTGRASYSPGGYPEIPAYYLLWDDLSHDMKSEGLNLCVRLEYYRIFVQGLYELLRGTSANAREMDQIRSRIHRLVRKQEPLDERLDRLDLDPRPRTPAAYHAHQSRPAIHSYNTYPGFAPVPPGYPPRPPPAPEVPLSPTSSSSSGHTYLSSWDTNPGSNSSAPGQMMHWGTYIFDGQHPVSPLHYRGETTKCLGRDEPMALKMLQDDGFLRVLELPFEATDVWVRLYWRPSDHRSRVLFLTKEKGVRRRFCIPLTAIKVLRAESTLQLCRVSRADGELDLWANLKFTCYERMVLFYSTLVAMKKQDWAKSPPGLEDYFHRGDGRSEVQEFGGEIEDNRFLHAFRIFRDVDSGGVRFEASARRGPMVKCPIWTAFVTSYIGSKTWMRRISSNTVQLRELKPYVFCDNYSPHKGPTGKFELKFTSKGDADEFMEVFHTIRIR